MIYKSSTALALVGVLSWLPAAAQSDLDPPDLGRYVKWGPFRVRPGLELSDFGYDDNILVTGADEVGDYTATLAPKLDALVLLGDRAFLTIEEKLEFTFYQDNTDQNFHNEKHSGRVTFPLQRMGFFVEAILNRERERPIDQEDIRPERDRDTIGVGVILRPAWRTEIEISRSDTSWSYFDPDEDPNSPTTIDERLDRREYRDAVNVTYQLMGRTRLTLDAYGETIEFDSAVSQGKDSRERSVMPGVDFGDGGGLSGSARLGWTAIDPDDPGLPGFGEVVGDAELAYRVGSRTTVRLEGRREPGFTATGDSVYYLDTRLALRAVYYLNPFLGVESGGSIGELTFPGAEDDRVDELDAYHVGLRFRLAQDSMGRRVEYSLKLERSRRDSTEDSLDRSRTTIGLGAVLGF